MRGLVLLVQDLLNSQKPRFVELFYLIQFNLILCVRYRHWVYVNILFMHNPPSCTPQLTNLQVTCFGLPVESASDLFVIKSYTKTLTGILHVRFRFHFLTTNVTKCVKIHKSCVKLQDECILCCAGRRFEHIYIIYLSWLVIWFVGLLVGWLVGWCVGLFFSLLFVCLIGWFVVGW